MFVTIVEDLLPQNFYGPNLKGTLIDATVVKELLSEKIPKLGAHLEKIGFDIAIMGSPWLMKLFCGDFPIETTLDVWDLFFCDGNVALFQCMLSLLKHNEERILTEADEFGMMAMLYSEISSTSFKLCKLVRNVSKRIKGWNSLESKIAVLRKKVAPQVEIMLRKL